MRHAFATARTPLTFDGILPDHPRAPPTAPQNLKRRFGCLQRKI